LKQKTAKSQKMTPESTSSRSWLQHWWRCWLYQRDESRLYDPAHTLLAFSGMHDRGSIPPNSPWRCCGTFPFTVCVRNDLQLYDRYGERPDSRCASTSHAAYRTRHQIQLRDNCRKATDGRKHSQKHRCSQPLSQPSVLRRHSFSSYDTIHYSIWLRLSFPNKKLRICTLLCVFLLPINSVPCFFYSTRNSQIARRVY